MAKSSGLNFNLPSVDDLFSTEEERAEARLEKIVNLSPAEISDFPNHPFKLTKEYYTLCHQGSQPFEVMTPKCVVIIGKISTMDSGQIAAFENFRNSLNNILVITFDELYQRIIDLITILSENTEQEIEPSSQNGNEEYPF